MERQTYLQILKDSFGFLFEKYDYTIVHHIGSESFLNAQTYLQSKDFILLILNDWSQIFLDLKPNDPKKPLKKQLEGFYDFRLILKLLEVPEEKVLEELYENILSEMFCDGSDWCNVVEKERGAIQMHELARIFEKYYEQILDLFSEEKVSDTKTKLKALSKERAKGF